jgi:hypothetical protein
MSIISLLPICDFISTVDQYSHPPWCVMKREDICGKGYCFIWIILSILQSFEIIIQPVTVFLSARIILQLYFCWF